jgi:hypothetical protein
MKTIAFSGTVGRFNRADFEAGALVVEYSFELKKETNARVLFSTAENCRVFLDGDYAFGREGGRVAPSPHRVPVNQAVDKILGAGMHTVAGVIARPSEEKEIEWIVGVADRDDNDQWVPNVISSASSGYVD